jgi:hypothetical protein
MAVDRGHATQGQVVRLGIKFTLAGTPIDPFEIRQVEVLDTDLGVLVTFTGSSIVRDAVGQYHVDWPIPSAEPPNVHYDRWAATAINGGTEEVFTNIFQVLTFDSSNPNTPYLTTSEARAVLPVDSEITDLQLSEKVLLAQETIEWITGRNFIPRSMARTFDGSGRGVLSIGRPIQSVTEARILSCAGPSASDTLLDVSTIRIAGSKRMLALGNVQRFSACVGGWGWNTYPPRGFPGACGVWPSGFQNIRITGDWGQFPSLPRQIRQAMYMLIRYSSVCDDPFGPMDAAFSKESIAGERDYTMREVWKNATSPANATGYADVDAILARFKEVGTFQVV